MGGITIKATGIKHKLFGGYQWRRYKTDKIASAKNIKKKGVGKPVYQYSLDGEYIRSFNSASEASNFFHRRNSASINDACSGRLKQCYGYQWRKFKAKKIEPFVK